MRRGSDVVLVTLVSVFLNCTLCRSVTLMVGNMDLLLVLPLLNVLLLFKVLAEEDNGGAGGAGGGGGTPPELYLEGSSSVASGIEGKGPGGMDAG